MAGKIPVPNFDPARIPQTTDEVNFHADATYVFERMAADIIPDFNHNFDWFEGALTGDLTSLVDSMTAYKAALTTLGHRNKIMNGQFAINQRGKASYTVSGEYTLDRWRLDEGGGSANTIKQGTFDFAQTDVPGDPQNFLIWERATAGTGSSFIQQRVENVETFAGQTVTVTFFAKATAATEMRPRISQYFGTGGSPSSQVDYVGADQSVNTSWQKFSVTFSLNSLATKTLGTNNNDFLSLTLFRDHDDTNPTATMHIANVSLVLGDATSEADPGAWRDRSIERLMCQRYFWMVASYDNLGGAEFVGLGTALNATTAFGVLMFPTEMRAVPSAVSPIVSNGYNINVAGTSKRFDSFQSAVTSTRNARVSNADTIAVTAGDVGTFFVEVAGASLAFDAEL